VILYELLTGRYPYQTASPEPGRDELIEAISQQAPEQPSRAVERGSAEAPETRALRKLLDGDLERIVIKALQKEPKQRYRSAAALADDIDRFLQGRPVQAHPPGRFYVAGKLIRRHPALTTLGVLLLAGLVTGLVLTSVSLVRTRRALARVEVASRTAHTAVDELLTRIDREHLLATPDLAPIRADLLDAFLRHYERASEAAGSNLAARLEGARARRKVGRIYELMGLRDVATWTYEAAVEAHRELDDGTAGPREGVEERASLLAKLGELLVAEGGRLAEARAILEQARTLLKGEPSGKDGGPEARRTLAKALGSLAELERSEGRREQAVAHWREALGLIRGLVSGKAATLEDLIAFGDSLIGSGRVLAENPETAGRGLEELTRGVELRQAIVRTVPSRVDQAEALGREYRELSVLHQSAGRSQPAVENARRAVEVYEQLDRRFPETRAYQTELYLAEDELGRLLALSNEVKPALDHAVRARTVLEQLVAKQPKDRGLALDLSRSHSLVGRLLKRRRAYAEALQSFQRAVDQMESVGRLGGEDSYVLAANLSLCVSLFGSGPDSPPPDDESTLGPADTLRRQVYGKRAVAALARAVEQGIKDPELYRTDPDLDALRDRPDFQKLLQELAEKAKGPDAAGR
jgi:non-specific serine/threonine protein kinase/serine/threonine-protein kinase